MPPVDCFDYRSDGRHPPDRAVSEADAKVRTAYPGTGTGSRSGLPGRELFALQPKRGTCTLVGILAKASLA